jgi:hypothetical protein
MRAYLAAGATWRRDADPDQELSICASVEAPLDPWSQESTTGASISSSLPPSTDAHTSCVLDSGHMPPPRDRVQRHRTQGSCTCGRSLTWCRRSPVWGRDELGTGDMWNSHRAVGRPVGMPVSSSHDASDEGLRSTRSGSDGSKVSRRQIPTPLEASAPQVVPASCDARPSEPKLVAWSRSAVPHGRAVLALAIAILPWVPFRESANGALRQRHRSGGLPLPSTRSHRGSRWHPID